MAADDADRPVGLWGAVVTLIGLVVGASIFILPGTLAASTGPAVLISYLLAAGLGLFACLVAASLGRLFPVSGASFIVNSRMLSPFFGFLGAWFMLAGAAVATAFLAYGFADYVALLWPGGINRTSTALMLVLGFGGLNLLGARTAVIGQGVMVVLFMLALLVFCVAGLAKINPDQLTPFTPNGMSPVISAAIPAFFSFTGFMLIIELGGEIKQPHKTIGQSLLISFITVLLIYAAVSLTLVGIVPWQQFADIAAPVGYVARMVLPDWAASLIALTAMAAAATSVNGILLTYSRDIHALATAGLFPTVLARQSDRYGDPSNAVSLMTLMAAACVLASGAVLQYAALLVLAVLSLQVLLGLALLRCYMQPRRLLHVGSPHDTPLIWLISSLGLIAGSLALIVIAAYDNPKTSLVAGGWLLAGASWFILRRRHLRRSGIANDPSLTTQNEADQPV